jgi:hypothetical protein
VAIIIRQSTSIFLIRLWLCLAPKALCTQSYHAIIFRSYGQMNVFEASNNQSLSLKPDDISQDSIDAPLLTSWHQ